jgi:diguanylate cyclase (GGDEF)-like protein
VSASRATPATAERGGRPILDLASRLRAGQVLLGFAAVLAVTALARPLADDRPVWLRASVLLLLATGAAASAILTSLRGRGAADPLALYAFLVLGVDALAQWLSPQGWPVWPAMVLLVAGVSIAEPMTTALGIAALAATLEAAEAARGGFTTWKPALMAVAGYGGLVLAVTRALATEKQRLSTTLAELARLRHGIGHLEDTLSIDGAPGAVGLRPVSEEERRTRQMERVADLDASLERLVRLARQALSAHAVILFSVDREQEHACLRAADGPSGLRKSLIPVRQDPFAFTVGRGQTFYVTDFKPLLWALPYYEGEIKIGSLLAAPVLEAGTVRGVLVADHLELQALGGPQHEMLESFAEMVSDVFVRARELADQEERGTELGIVHHVSKELAQLQAVNLVCERLRNFAQAWMPLEGGAVVRVDEAKTRYTVDMAFGWAEPFNQREVALEERTLVTWAVNQATTVRLNEVGREGKDMPVLVLDEDSRAEDSVLVLPLSEEAPASGALVLTARRGALRASATSVVEILVNQASAIVAKIQLAEREKERAESEKRRAMKDPLTDLYNRRAFSESLAQSIARRERQGGTLCLLMLDLDHFKKLNDTHGHPAGDAALRTTADVLRRVLRKGDVPARYGGEEFVVMLPGASEAVAQQIAERLRASLESAAIEYEGATIQVTASVGLAVWPENGTQADELMAAADRALYAAKAGGRNRVVCAPKPVARELNI